MKPIVAAIASSFALALPCQAVARDCTREEAFAAQTITDYLDSWDNVLLFFKQFHHCYDGAIAGGAQDKIQLLWATRWNELPRMIALTDRDPGFKDFLWVVLRSEAFPQDTFAQVVNNARRSCPPGAREFCAAVKKAAAVKHGA
jgi:hypothetical protein